MKRGLRTFTSLLFVVVLGSLLGVLVLNLGPAFIGPPTTAADPRPTGETAPAAPAIPAATASALPPLPASAPLPDTAVLEERLAKAFKRDGAGGFSGQVTDLATGKVLYGKRGATPAEPASNLKILTATAALAMLGAGTRLPTTTLLGADGTVILVGGGDVLLGAGASDPDAVVGRAGLRTLAERTAMALLAGNAAMGSGDRKPHGDGADGGAGTDDAAAATDGTELKVVLDDSLFTGEALNPVWDASLMRTSNISAVRPVAMYGARTDSRPKSPRVKDPSLAAARTFRAALATALKDQQAKAALEAQAAQAARDAAASAQALDPASAAAPAPSSASARLGNVRVAASVVRGHAAGGEATLAVVHSATVREQLRFMTGESDNYVAEAMGRLVAIAAGKPATFGGATESIREAIDRLGVDTRGMLLADASGLAAANRIAPKQLTDTLRAAARSSNPDLRELTYLLPISGTTGTLDNRLRADAVRGRIRAKTGTLAGVATLGGTVVTQDNRLLAFAFFGHGFRGSLAPARAGLDRAAAVLAACGCTR